MNMINTREGACIYFWPASLSDRVESLKEELERAEADRYITETKFEVTNEENVRHAVSIIITHMYNHYCSKYRSHKLLNII